MAADPIHQFQISKLFTITTIGGHEIAFTNSALFMVIILVIGPAVAGFAGRQATLAYVLAGVLFALTLLTRFPLGVIKVVRLPTHGAIECVLALMLIVLPWLADFARGIHSRNFYVLIGALMLFLWFLTDFRGVRDRSTAPPAL